MTIPRKTNCLFALAFASSILASGVGKADDRKDEPSRGDAWVPVKRLVFTPDDIEGGTLAPEGVRIESIRRAEQSSLIELREGFEAELVKTMEDM
jgi:hypothetical protein